MGVASLKAILFDDIVDRCLLILSGMFFMMFGGWLLSLWTYKGVLFGFIKGLLTPVLRSIVMSRKSTVFMLPSIVIF